MNKNVLTIICVAVGCVAATSIVFWLSRPQQAAAVPAPTVTQSSAPQALAEPIQPIRAPANLDPRKIDLGRKLFHDVRLSANDSVSCASCHSLETGGVDRRSRSVGIHGAEGDINAPTVLNSALNFKLFWDGRAATLEEQIDGPTQHPKEMGSNWPQIIGKLSKDAEYVSGFTSAYADGLTAENVKSAIADFERSLVTLNSRFDRFLMGDASALSDREKRGYQLFKDLGCISCHQGMNAGGNMFQPFGVMGDYFADRGDDVTKADLGRFNVTGKPQDRHRFRVPGLRNVELTAPYFHDGSAANLDQAVRTMAQYQLGQDITDEEVGLIVEFLNTLTGEDLAKGR